MVKGALRVCPFFILKLLEMIKDMLYRTVLKIGTLLILMYALAVNL